VRWARDLARALQHAHDNGVIHRDVKPGNIRITPRGRPLLLDFGIARDAVAGPGLTQTYAGSPLYSAPEQLMGRALDGRADVYALGIVLYEMITGRAPFRGGSFEQVLRRCLAEAPLAPRRLDPSLPRDLETVVLKAIAKDPAARYATAGDLAEDLDAVREGRPVRARPPGPLRKAGGWLRRHPRVAAALAAALLAGLVLLGRAWQERRRAVREARDLVARAGEMVDDLERRSRRATDVEKDVLRLREELATQYLDASEERRLRDGESELARIRRAREEAFHRVLAQLRRADQLDPAVTGSGLVRARLYEVRAREAEIYRDPLAAAFWRELAEREAPGHVGSPATRRVTIRSEPGGAEVFLFACREQAELAEDGERRLVPVPIGQQAPVPPGTWVLRVVGEDWHILEVAGHPVRDAALAVESAGAVQAGDRLLAIDGVAVTSPGQAREVHAGSRLRFARAGDVTDSPVALGSAADLAGRGGVRARVLRGGRISDVVLPRGLAVRTTAAPAFLLEPSGVTPFETRLPAGQYMAVVRPAGGPSLRIAFTVKDETEISVRAPPDGIVAPPGFLYVPAPEPFWILEREVTCGDYLAFLNDPQAAAGGRFPRAPHNAAEGGYWPRDADGRFRLPADWHADWPILGVDFEDAAAYAAWRTASAPAGFLFALPSYEEWLFAGRGLGNRSYSFGNVFWPKWMNSNFSRPRPGIEPVLSYPVDESPFGVYDMAGGVSEWLDAPYGDEPDARRVGGGGWGEGKLEVFRLENGLGFLKDVPRAQVGFRLVMRRTR